MICANLILASRQGFGELKTEQLGGHSQEQQRHRQAPIDDDDDEHNCIFGPFSVLSCMLQLAVGPGCNC